MSETNGQRGRVILRTEGLRKQYGRIVAVQDLNIEVYDGEVFSFLGPNGSGKSTTVGMMLGLIKPTRGRVLAFGQDMTARPWPALRRIGALAEAATFYPYLSGYDNLKALTILLGDIHRKRIDEVLELVGLRERAKDPYRTYSLGMKQRLGIAAALMREPELIILDEPTNGLDPAGTAEVRDLIPELARQGRSVFLCSHLLYEVQQVSDRVAIVKNGRLISQGGVDELLRRGRFLRLRAEDNTAVSGVLGAIAWVRGVEAVDGYLRVDAPVEKAAELNRILSSKELYLSELGPWETDLESVFLGLTQGSSE